MPRSWSCAASQPGEPGIRRSPPQHVFSCQREEDDSNRTAQPSRNQTCRAERRSALGRAPLAPTERVDVSRQAKAEGLLAVVAFIWGSTFVIVKGALADASPLPFLAIRFTLAGILLWVVLSRGRVDREAIKPGLVLGAFLFVGYLCQTSGLTLTTPSKSAFITGFGVIVVPLILMFRGVRLRTANMMGAAGGFLGIYLLVAPSKLHAVNLGDVLTLLGALSFAVHIVLVGGYARRFSFLHLVPVQILVVGLLAALASPLQPARTLHWTARLVFALVVTVLLATGFAFTVQNWAQQYTPPAHTALIFALEPVFAAVASRVATGEHLGGRVLLGSALILGGMVASEVWGGVVPSPVES
jgi:drug/metabolite transporter (DMT)-like permease